MFNMDAKISLYSYTILSECSCHRLPLWEPFAVLGVLSILVGIIFYNQKDYSSVSDGKKYCSECGNKTGVGNKYCASCGVKL